MSERESKDFPVPEVRLAKDTEFAVIDFETTGLKAGLDRVLEVGVVRTDARGNVLDEFSTLVNPKRDVGPTSIHGISASAVASAPEFGEIIGNLAGTLNGAVLVAHNSKFDLRFLRMELERCGATFDSLDALCTLELMFLGYPNGPRRLGDCCSAFGLPCGHAHDALEDARMASGLLHFLLGKVPVVDLPSPISISAPSNSSCELMPRGSVGSLNSRQGTYLSGLVQKLDDSATVGLISAVSVAQYMNLLDRVLEDRRITSDEADDLVSFADDLSLGRARVEALHAAYVTNLCSVIRADGVVTDAEIRDLAEVSELLGVRDWQGLLDGSGQPPASTTRSGGLEPGFSVCFTGEMEISRTELESRSANVGLTVKGGVTKSLGILVVADADSLSGKAKKARDYGIRMVAERVFLQMLEELERVS